MLVNTVFHQSSQTTAASANPQREQMIDAQGTHQPVHAPAPNDVQFAILRAITSRCAVSSGLIVQKGYIAARCEWCRWLSSKSRPSQSAIPRAGLATVYGGKSF